MFAVDLHCWWATLALMRHRSINSAANTLKRRKSSEKLNTMAITGCKSYNLRLADKQALAVNRVKLMAIKCSTDRCGVKVPQSLSGERLCSINTGLIKHLNWGSSAANNCRLLVSPGHRETGN